MVGLSQNGPWAHGLIQGAKCGIIDYLITENTSKKIDIKNIADYIDISVQDIIQYCPLTSLYIGEAEEVGRHRISDP